MTKQEHEARSNQYDECMQLPLAREYISALEAEVAKLNMALDVLIRCMVDVERCVCDEAGMEESECSDECSSCWREYALAQAEEDK